MMRFLLTCGLILSVSGASLAQTPPAVGLGAGPAQNELLALNFYVQQADQTAVAAELRRLQLKYPTWVPPTDLSSIGVSQPSVEVDEIYRLIAAARYAEARAAIRAAEERYPDWKAPAEMLDLLDTSERQAQLDSALTAADLQKALSLVADSPSLLSCNRINNAWRIADAQAAAGQKAAALATYRAVAGACINRNDLIATIEKADALASDDELRALIASTATRLPQLQADLEALQLRLLAGRGQQPAQTVIAIAPVAPVAAAPSVKPQPSAPPAAAAATTAGPSSQNAAPASGGGASGGGGAFAAAVAAGDWAKCVTLSNGARQASMIYQRGWCAYNLDQPMEAVSAFRSALSMRLSAEQRRDANYGIALAYLKMGMVNEASQLAVSTNFTRQQQLDIERQILDQRGVNAYKRRDYRGAIAYLNALEQLTGNIRRDLGILRAYAYLNLGERSQAQRLFEAMNRELSTPETRRGLQASSGG